FRGQAEGVALAPLDLPFCGEERGALVVNGEGLQAELVDECEHRVLGGADPLAAELDRLPGGEDAVLVPAGDAVPRLEHEDVEARIGQRPGGGEPRQAGPDDDDVVEVGGRAARGAGRLGGSGAGRSGLRYAGRSGHRELLGWSAG